MNNAEKFKNVFDIYATELWAMPEEDFLRWLNEEEAEGLTEGRWVSVTERLPEENCKCRVTVKNEFGKYVGDCFWNNGKKQFENWSAYLNCYVKVYDVTAWKPIEEPYTEEES